MAACCHPADGVGSSSGALQVSAVERKRIQAWSKEVEHALQTHDPRLWLIAIVMFWTVLTASPLLVWINGIYPLKCVAPPHEAYMRAC